MTNDLINAGFEFTGALMVLLNVLTLFKDKIVRGVHIGPTLYFTLWGCWNVYYYPSLGQHWSFVAGTCICTANILWIALMLYYKHKEKIRNQDVKFAATPEGSVHG